MGYYVEMLGNESNLVLKANIQEEVFSLWKKLNSTKNNHLKTSGSWVGGKRIVYCYPSMDKDYDKTVKNTQSILKMLGFSYTTSKNKDIRITGYDGKSGVEGLFFETISHLIEPKSHIVWLGEDKYEFVWHFYDNKLIEMPFSSYTKTLMYDEFSNEIISKKDNKKNIKI